MSKDKNNNILTTSFTSVRTYEDDTTTICTFVEFTKEAGISEDRARELVDFGWLQPIALDTEEFSFRQVDVYKARKAGRICDDFDLPSLAGAIIVDLLDRIDDLEARLKEKE